jgi:hypothetical protein
MKPMRVEFVKQEYQNYPTVGDYFETPEFTVFRITEFPGKPAYAAAILLHEIAEYFRTKQDGITIGTIDSFDLTHPELDDPGLSQKAPYHRQHMESDVLERQFILFSGEDWVEYEAAIDKLFAE